MSAQIIAVDHFAGLGWGVACERLRIREYGVEIAPSAIRMRSANGLRTIYRNVWTGLFNPHLVPEHDLYIASPPCQTFSMAGKGEGRKALDDVLRAIYGHRYTNAEKLHRLNDSLDPRTSLVLTPLAHIYGHRPRLVALEQVPEVMPVWHAYANIMRGFGYSVWTGILRAEQYGVPQTRKRAILMARLDGKVQPPPPTHSRYYSTDPVRLDPGVEKWVSMAEALGVGDRSRVFAGAGKTAVETSGQIPREMCEPAHTVTGSQTAAWVLNGQHRITALTSKASSEKPSWPAERPAPTIVTSRRAAGGMLVGRQLGDGSRRDVGGHSGRSGLKPGQLPGVRVTYREAAALQSFPPGMAWPGNQGERFLAIGNAVPPLLAESILGALLEPPAERDSWDHVFAEVAG
ncbi:DNA cytosine methyltransferase [Leucobacter sp. CSA1]|uniref:DNA (cytosine-5-)-methyltransferase n=1 Tax=Leucobacter chromiisoli TaxID=2796471 RepID=A0A934Q914_9MICO|nr:DNA cytosine methyltransferase [Leucobacter chromiisoli]MBK0419978.1 DNA cytosine methyltransferase [Leucobacter chromiisoli]